MPGFLLLFAADQHIATRAGEAFAAGAARLGKHVVSRPGAACLLASCGADLPAASGPLLRFGVGRIGPDAPGDSGFEQWIGTLEGSFAAVEIDRDSGALRVARDRFGAVAVYFLDVPGFVAVSTRLACLVPFLGEARLDEAAMAECLRFRWCSGTRSLAQGVAQLEPGSVLEWRPGTGVALSRWWRMQFDADGAPDPGANVAALRCALEQALDIALAPARTPALLLSGGVDSSVIAALALPLRPDLRCYIATVPGAGAEELRRARFVAELVEVPLHEVELDTGVLAADLPRVVELLEEPPRNPNNLVLAQLYAAMARDGVDLALNGDGPEMLLGLADSVRTAQFDGKRRQATRLLPGAVRDATATTLRRSDSALAWRLARVLGEDTVRYALALDELEYAPALRRLGALRVQRGREGCAWPQRGVFDQADNFDDALHLYQCTTTLMSSQRRHEAIARAHGIEAATPFLFTPVLEFARHMPRELRYTDRSRPVLKQLCDELVHSDVARWEKLGFPVPWEQWLQEQLGALLGEPSDYAHPSAPITPQFVREAFRLRDPEALWTLLGLRLLRQHLGVRAEKPASRSRA